VNESYIVQHLMLKDKSFCKHQNAQPATQPTVSTCHHAMGSLVDVVVKASDKQSTGCELTPGHVLLG